MHKKKTKSIQYYATILFVVSITMLIYGIILDIGNSKRLFDPVKDSTPIQEEESTVSITTIDGSEVVPGNTITKVKDKTKEEIKEEIKEKGKEEKPKSTPTPSPAPSNNVPSNNNQGTSNTTSPNSSGSSNTGSNNNGNANQNAGQGSSTVHIPTIEETNNSIRNNIQNTYGISVKYGSETIGYTVGGISTTPIDDSTAVNAALNRLKNALSLYPSGFFYEIKSGGIPLTVILINSYANNSITGVTDSSYTYADISIAVSHPFEESFYHESYHYMERYLFKRGANYNSWNTLNPVGFNYGTIVNSYSYANTFSENAFFVNTYAQVSDAEDRASTFEYMMGSSKASCLNYGKAIWYKATLMKNTIEAVFNTVSPNNVEYWERYL